MPAITSINQCYELSIFNFLSATFTKHIICSQIPTEYDTICQRKIVCAESFHVFLPFFGLICASQSVCTKNSSEHVRLCLQSLTVITYFQRWHLIHANKSPRRPSVFCQAYPMRRSVSTQAGVIKANRWLGEWSRGKQAWTTLPNLIFQPWEASSETTTVYILIFITQRGIQLKTASLILINLFQLYLA